jgi:hypothetical protein
MNTRRHCLYLFGFAVIVLSVLGCSADSQNPEVSPLAVALGGSDQVLKDGSRLIGPSGGVVAKGGVVVEVPPGALDTETRIGIILRADGSVDLTPDGQRFSVPVQLHLVVPAGKAASACVVQWYDPSQDLWVTIESAASGIERVAPLPHFSVYRTISLVE